MEEKDIIINRGLPAWRLIELSMQLPRAKRFDLRKLGYPMPPLPPPPDNVLPFRRKDREGRVRQGDRGRPR